MKILPGVVVEVFAMVEGAVEAVAKVAAVVGITILLSVLSLSTLHRDGKISD